MKDVTQFVAIMLWIAGIITAKGAWATLFSIIIPPYAWYLIIEKIMSVSGLLT